MIFDNLNLILQPLFLIQDINFFKKFEFDFKSPPATQLKW